MLDVLQQAGAQSGLIFRPVETSGQSLTFRKVAEGLEHRNWDLLNQIKQAMRVCEGLFAHDFFPSAFYMATVHWRNNATD